MKSVLNSTSNLLPPSHSLANSKLINTTYAPCDDQYNDSESGDNVLPSLSPANSRLTNTLRLMIIMTIMMMSMMMILIITYRIHLVASNLTMQYLSFKINLEDRFLLIMSRNVICWRWRHLCGGLSQMYSGCFDPTKWKEIF